MPQAITRRQTCPITRRESEQLLDFFINIPTSPKETEKPIAKHNHLDNDTVNNNIEKPENDIRRNDRPEFKRSDSYRKATQKFTLLDVVEMTMTFKKEDYERQKYLSLPVDIKSRIKNDQKKLATVTKKNKLNRQKSGTVPSSDSEGPTNKLENRQKKSIFKRTKERIIFRLWKDKARTERIRKNKVSKQETSPKRITNFGNSKDALGINPVKVQSNTTSNDAEGSEPKRGSYKRSPQATEDIQRIQLSPTSSMAPNTKSPARARRFRTQVSREEITTMFEKILSSAEVKDEPFKFPSSPGLSREHGRKDFSPAKDLSFSDGIKDKKAGLHLDIVAFSPALRVEDQLTITTETTRTSSDRNETVTERTTLQRTFSLEVDGGDEVDGPTGTSVDAEKSLQGGEQSDDQEKMIEEIARRLSRIADDYVQRMGDGDYNAHVERGAVAEPLLSPRSRSRKLANDLVTELRKEGDRLSRELDLPDNLLPIVMDMVKQVTYDHFKELVQKALCETIGWDQVAMYFYVSKAAILMAGVGGTLARKLKNMVVKYFYEEISPWIHDKGGLETMLEETDSEVD